MNSVTVTLLVIAAALVCGFLSALAVTRFRAMIISLCRLLEGWGLLNNVIGLVLVYTVQGRMAGGLTPGAVKG